MAMKTREYAILFAVSLVLFYSMLAILSPINTGTGGTPSIGGVLGGTSGGACSGQVQLSFFPASVQVGNRVSALVSGVQNCNGKVVFVRQQLDSDQKLMCSCVVATGNGCGCSFNIPLNSCAFQNYLAQVDMNGNGDYNDAGETALATLPVNNCPNV